MTWNYSGDPSESDRDAVRFEIQDTNSSAPLLQDAEVDWCILNETGQAASIPTVLTMQQVYMAAARCMEILSGLFAAQADSQIGQLKLTYSKQAQTYATRAQEKRALAVGMSGPYAGAQSITEKESFEQNTDLPQPLFRRRQNSNPYAYDGGISGLPMPGNDC
ncbi:MAG: hypothetical protein ACYCQK_01660 [Acidiferrobacteraceae bacterium]